jgi:hypothetical protein
MLVEDIGNALVTAGIAASQDGADWQLFYYYMQDSPDRAIGIYETPGDPPEEGLALERPGFQIRVRSAPDGGQGAREKLKAIYDLLTAGEALLGADYVFVYASNSGALSLGQDENRRIEFVQNFRTMRARR